jgi:hypothetical protein
MIQKSVIIVCRSESIDDFHQIARRAHRLDPSIAVIPIAEHLHSSLIPKPLLNLPMLVIFLVNPPDKEFHLAGKMAVKRITKLEEYQHFKKHNIPCLPIEDFTWGMTLDKSIYGDWVVLKPQTITSSGKDVNMVPTDLISTLTLEDFPEDHLIRQDQYYVQKFVKTGEKPSHYRVLVFLNEVLMSTQSISKITLPETVEIKNILKISVASNNQEYREVKLFKNEKVINFALAISHVLKTIPLLGIDILQDDLTKELYVLETNAGGNTWAFSSKIARYFRHAAGGKKNFILQYNAWDIAAEALVKKAHMLAK